MTNFRLFYPPRATFPRGSPSFHPSRLDIRTPKVYAYKRSPKPKVYQGPLILIMRKVFQYCSLAAQASLVALLLIGALSCQIYISFQIQRNTTRMLEENKPWPLIFAPTVLLLLLDHISLLAFAWFFGVIGIDTRKGILIFPLIQLVASIIARYTGYLPVFTVASVSNIFVCLVLLIQEGDKNGVPCQLLVAPAEELSTKSRIPCEYRYKRFTRHRSIRLLSLEPCNVFKAPLKCQLFEVPLDDAPPYTALSYAWDASEGMIQIIYNGSLLSVTLNCARALCRIRQAQGSSSKVLWVDAICIDQGTNIEALSERSEQVQIMGDVYRLASCVVAWIGDHRSDSSREICAFLESVGRIFDYEPNDALAWTKAENLALGRAREWFNFFEYLRQFFQRSWFTKMWPIQEVTLPLPWRVFLLCGDSSMPSQGVIFLLPD